MRTLIQDTREFRPGTTLIELVVAVSLMALVMGAVLPLIGSLRNTWESSQKSTDALQIGRVLTNHLNLNLSQAARITAVSPASQTLGYIEFEDADGNTQRYDVDAQGNVEYGLTSSQADLAGPVSQFLFTCYDGNDFDTPITEVDDIRFIKLQATAVNAAAMGQDKAFSNSVYLQVNGNNVAEFSMGTPFEFDTDKGKEPALAQIDSTHYLCAYTGDGDDGWATVLNVNPSTWAISQGTPYEYDTVKSTTQALAQIDDTHYFCAYQGDGDDGWATILTVDTETWTITEEQPLEFDTDQGKYPDLLRIDESHFLCAYQGKDDDGWAVVLTVGDGLIGHWKLDETSGTTAADSSGNGYDGILTNMAGDEWCAGQVGGALQFDGYNDYVNLGTSSALAPSSITVSLWAKRDGSGDSNAWQDLAGRQDWGDGEGYVMYYNESNSRIYWRVIGNGGYDDVYASVADSTEWHLYTGTFSGSTSRLYVDGVLQDTDYSADMDSSSSGLAIGDDAAGNGSGEFDGIIDDVRIYNRALDADEVAALAQTLRYLDFTEAKANSDTTSLTIAPPASTSVGDLLVAAVATDGDTSATLAPPGGQGWTQIDLNDNSNEVTLGVWWKTAGASEPSHQFTWTGGQQAYAWIMRFTGHDATNPIDVFSASNTTSSSPISPSVTSTVDSALIVRLGAFDEDDITLDAPGLTDHTAITMDTNAGSGQVSFQELTEAKQPSNSSTSITLDTPAGTSSGNLLITAVVTDADTDSSMAPPPGENWTEIYTGDRDNQVSLGTWWKMADFNEPNDHEFTWSGGQQAYAWMMRFTGHDLSSPIHAWAKRDAFSSSPDLDPVTTTLDNCMILRIGAFDDGDVNSDITGLQGHSSLTMDESSSGDGECSGGAGYQQQATPGETDFTDFNLTDSEQYVTLTVAIAPSTDIDGTDAVAGGAGYVKQSSAGSSGASSFTLTASEQARMMTLAIAPAAQVELGATVISKGTAYEFESGKGKEPALVQIDDTHYLCAYNGDGDDGWAVVLTVDSDTWTVTKGSPYEFDHNKCMRPALARINDTHYLCAYGGDGDDGYAVVLTVNTSTWTITKGTPFEFDTVKGMEPALATIDSRNILCAYKADGDDGWSTVLAVDTDDWTISLGEAYEFDTDKGKQPALIQIDGDHYLCTYNGKDDDGWSVVLMPTTTGLQP